MRAPDVVEGPVTSLIGPAELAERAGACKALTPSVLASVQPGIEKPQTTHFSIVDRWGNAVAKFGWRFFQCPDLGLLNNSVKVDNGSSLKVV